MQLRQSGMTWQEVGSEIVVLDLDGSVYLAVNGSGTVLWKRLTEACSQDALVELLVEQFGIDESRARNDVADFLKALRARDLLVE